MRARILAVVTVLMPARAFDRGQRASDAVSVRRPDQPAVRPPVYTATNSPSGGCAMNRTTRAKKFTWNADGTPDFDVPAAVGAKPATPSGEPAS